MPKPEAKKRAANFKVGIQGNAKPSENKQKKNEKSQQNEERKQTNREKNSGMTTKQAKSPGVALGGQAESGGGEGLGRQQARRVAHSMGYPNSLK